MALAAFFLLSCQGFAKDFVSLQQEIASFSTTIEKIELAEGRHDFALIEPLHMLGKIQFQANLFSDAEKSIDRAIQIARFSDGLYSPVQYPLLQLAIDIELARQDWTKVSEKLEHYTWLISQQYQGEGKSRIQQARWIADVRLQAYRGDSEEMRAPHLIQATYLRETIVQFAQVMQLTADPLYGDLLFELANAYRIEADAIRNGGSTSYHLRRVFPGLEIIEEKRPAVEKRYRIGLEKLQMLQSFIAGSSAYDREAGFMVQLYLAQWHEFFDKHHQQQAVIAKALAGYSQLALNETEILTLLELQAGLSWERMQLELPAADVNLVAAGD
ncbi:MAG: hypothetical protein KJN90_09140 [Gammaproteobacteria bacterium]|nr:hypothetical protein [Gammaproteobacteria bacterium]